MTTVHCNAGPLIALGKLNRLELLAELYGQVQIPRAVYDEAGTQGLALGAPDARTIRLFWQAKNWPISKMSATMLSAYKPPVILDPGETEVLTLARALRAVLVLLDDETARAEARRLKLRVQRTIPLICGRPPGHMDCHCAAQDINGVTESGSSGCGRTRTRQSRQCPAQSRLHSQVT